MREPDVRRCNGKRTKGEIIANQLKSAGRSTAGASRSRSAIAAVLVITYYLIRSCCRDRMGRRRSNGAKFHCLPERQSLSLGNGVRFPDLSAGRLIWRFVMICPRNLLLFGFSVAASASAQHIVNFDFDPNGAPIDPVAGISYQWAQWGILFHDQNGAPVGVSGNNCSLSPPNHAYAGAIIAQFIDPLSGLPSETNYAGTAQDSCWVPGEGIDMEAYDRAGNLLDHQFNSGGGNFVAFQFATPVIAYLVMTPVLQGIDNFAFETPAAVCVGDFDRSGAVDLGDLTILLSHFGQASGASYGHGDMDGDGDIDLSDLTALLARFGSVCP
ncbi:MAG: hypothetical protein HZB38_01835 [Planctomycetes bacterium]|nr:hypothetical protein [Planctomycetota bacterium]